MIRDGLSNTIFMGELRALCTGAPRSGWVNSTNGCGYITTTVPINYDSCGHDSLWRDVNGCRTTCNGNVTNGFKSCHPGGAQFLFGDGSVSFLSEGIDGWAYQVLGRYRRPAAGAIALSRFSGRPCPPLCRE